MNVLFPSSLVVWKKLFDLSEEDTAYILQHKFEMASFSETSVNKSTLPRFSGDNNLLQSHSREDFMFHPFGNTFDFLVNSSCHFGGLHRLKLAESNT
jgi:hypothetical protein